MQDTTSSSNFSSISLDNLDTVAGGYHDPSGPLTPPRTSGDPPASQPQGTLGAHIADLLKRFADLAGHAAPQK